MGELWLELASLHREDDVFIFSFWSLRFVLTWPPGKLHARDGSVGWQSRRNYAQRHDLFLETFRERDQKLGKLLSGGFWEYTATSLLGGNKRKRISRLLSNLCGLVPRNCSEAEKKWPFTAFEIGRASCRERVYVLV